MRHGGGGVGGGIRVTGRAPRRGPPQNNTAEFSTPLEGYLLDGFLKLKNMAVV